MRSVILNKAHVILPARRSFTSVGGNKVKPGGAWGRSEPVLVHERQIAPTPGSAGLRRVPSQNDNLNTRRVMLYYLSSCPPAAAAPA